MSPGTASIVTPSHLGSSTPSHPIITLDTRPLYRAIPVDESRRLQRLSWLWCWVREGGLLCWRPRPPPALLCIPSIYFHTMWLTCTQHLRSHQEIPSRPSPQIIAAKCGWIVLVHYSLWFYHQSLIRMQISHPRIIWYDLPPSSMYKIYICPNFRHFKCECLFVYTCHRCSVAFAVGRKLCVKCWC